MLLLPSWLSKERFFNYKWFEDSHEKSKVNLGGTRRQNKQGDFLNLVKQTCMLTKLHHKSTEEQSNSVSKALIRARSIIQQLTLILKSHSLQNQMFSMEQMMVSPLLGPAMVNTDTDHKKLKDKALIFNQQPFQDASDEDLEILDYRPLTSSSFGTLKVRANNA